YVGTYNARVYSMNYETGATIDTMLTNPPIRIAGLTFNGAGDLWACVRPLSGPVDGIYRINFLTGATTLVGYTGLGGGILDILFSKGKLYGITDSTGPNKNSLIQINTSTGVGTVIGPTGLTSVQALATIPDNVTSVREMRMGAQPMKYTLEQNYPNPFNPSTEIQFSLPAKSHVTLKIFDLLGREVARLVSEELSLGSYKSRWDANGLSTGVYLYRLQAGEFVDTKKLLLLR
ncbi:MAG: 5'-Nucleotidase domain protein, partial [Bacteroidetes bacterium]|nr:5'-Nucleotidase domain protein [Bacteroidota bacterium]